MSARSRIEGALLATVFALAGVLPAGLLLLLVVSAAIGGPGPYDDSATGLARGLARDVIDQGAASLIPAFLLLFAAGFAFRDALRGRPRRASRLLGRATILAFLAGLILLPDTLAFRSFRTVFAFAGAGLTLTVVAAALSLRREPRGGAG